MENVMNEDLPHHIEEEIRSQRMIGDLISPIELLPQYEGAELPGFVPGIRYLSSKYQMRKVRGDGNCFYRSFLFAYLEQLLKLHASDREDDRCFGAAERLRFENIVAISKNDLISIGYSEIAIESFHDIMQELVSSLFTLDLEALNAMFQEDGQSDYFTWFMRLLTAGAMLREADKYLPFVQDDLTPDMSTYVKREVEPMGKECEQMQITALTEYLNVPVDIVYLDGRLFSEEGGLPVICCCSGDGNVSRKLVVHLLYRPGHYDILYPKP